MDRRYAMATVGPQPYASGDVGQGAAVEEQDVIGLGNMMRPETWLSCSAFLGMLFAPQIGSQGPMIMLAVSAMLMFRNPPNVLVGTSANWPMLIFPFYCLLSVLWSNAPAATARASMELIVTFLFAFQLARERRRGSIVTGIFLAFFIYDLVALLLGHKVSVGNFGDKAFSGLNGGKNYQADTSTLGLFASVAFIMDTNPLKRPFSILVAAAAALLHVFLVIQAKSAGAYAGLVVGAGVIASFSMLRKATPSTRLTAIILFVFFGGLISIYQGQIADAVLTLFGKDTTLTGRSYLWYRAEGIIADHPVEGQGFNAFWLKGNSDAEGLWRWGNIATRTGFNFHNTYYETLVALGIVGLVLLVTTWVGCVVRVVREYVRLPDVVLCYWLGILAYEMFRTPFESIGPGPLQFSTVLYLTAMAATGVAIQPALAGAPYGAVRSSRSAQRSRPLWRTARARPAGLPHPQTPAT